VSVISASNETGVVQDLSPVVAAARAVGALVHVDAVQHFGRLPLDVATLGADLVTVSAHKLGGPRGAGALWVRPGVTLRPLIVGGHQERNRRGGTENVAAAAGFAEGRAPRDPGAPRGGAAARRAVDDAVAAALRAGSAARGLLGDGGARLPNTVCVLFPGADGEALLFGLDLAGISASSGSACTAGSLEPSHVLLAMGIDGATARGALRLSLGWRTTAADIAHVCDVLPGIVDRARQEAA
jgi:cysteine desulfurase